MHARMHGFHGLDAGGAESLPIRVMRSLKTTLVTQSHLMMKMLADERVHPAQAFCLGALSHGDGMSQSDLADMLQVSRPSVTSMLQRLESAGMIERRTDEQDQRLTRIYLTESGRQVATRMREAYMSTIELTVGRMSKEDQLELERLLNTLKNYVREAAESR